MHAHQVWWPMVGLASPLPEILLLLKFGQIRGQILVSRSQTPPLFDIWTAGRESGALTLKLLFRVLPMTSLVI